MRFNLERVTKRFTKSLKKSMERQYFMPLSSTCRLQPCGYHHFLLQVLLQGCGVTKSTGKRRTFISWR
ncbi:hypothetical protein Gohar_026279 [Gossypium harknessii]|uniref:Uncharacterized protein n=1 Tax=Gossypium harknessii TaxID=34285 RepID=A0A7J9HR11_9ROSI|nr:hypothetical protein [Gossypium harknessii]